MNTEVSHELAAGAFHKVLLTNEVDAGSRYRSPKCDKHVGVSHRKPCNDDPKLEWLHSLQEQHWWYGCKERCLRCTVLDASSALLVESAASGPDNTTTSIGRMWWASGFITPVIVHAFQYLSGVCMRVLAPP